MMRTFSLFISDLHLHLEDPVVTERFHHFIQNVAPTTESLYILGDFFEAWIGDDDKTPFNFAVSQSLKTLREKGIPVYFMHGNRDFLIGKQYAKQSGFEILKDPSVITCYNYRILLTHGDALCTQDVRHQRYRHFVLNPFIQWMLLCLPLSVRRNMAKRLRKNSTQHNRNTPAYIMDVTESKVLHHMQANDVTFMVHGHTHRPNIHRFQVTNTIFTRIVLGAWHNNAEYLKLYSDGQYELLSYAK